MIPRTMQNRDDYKYLLTLLLITMIITKIIL